MIQSCSSMEPISIYFTIWLTLKLIKSHTGSRQLNLPYMHQKTKYILFWDKSTLFDFKQYDLKIENTIIEWIGTCCKEKYFKYVSIRIDEFLTWEFYKKYLKGKLSCAVFALAQICNLLSSKIQLTIYNSLFRLHLEYCILVHTYNHKIKLLYSLIHTWGLSGGKEPKGIEIPQ